MSEDPTESSEEDGSFVSGSIDDIDDDELLVGEESDSDEGEWFCFGNATSETTLTGLIQKAYQLSRR